MSNVGNAIELTRALLRFNTINPPGDEEACTRFAGKILEDAGFRVSYYAFAPTRVSLVASLGGAADKLPICFTGHIDTVPLGAAPWRTDPFAGEIEDGKLYGRGSSDMKSGIAAFMIAALDMSETLRRGPGIVLVLTAGEEVGCAGAFHLASLDNVLGRAGAIVVAEPTANYPLIGHRGALWLNARTRGVTAHGSMPERGVNAIYKAANAVSLLEKFQFEDGTHPLMGKATLNVGTIHGGLNVNSVPDETNIGIDIRTVPGQEHSRLYSCLCHCLGPEVELDKVFSVDSVYTDPADPWIQSVFEITGRHLGEQPEPRTVPFITDATALTRAYNFAPTVILGPGEPALAHQTDEYCVIDKLDQAVGIYREIIEGWCK
jgi:succinyl-diaminopimelate desuccinylase